MRSLSILLAVLALAPFAGGEITGAGVAWVQNGFLTHPGDKGTWTMSGAIVDQGTFVRVCVKCTGASADLRGTYRGKKGTFILLAHIELPQPDRWTLLSGTGSYAGLHGSGTCVGRLIINEVSFRDRCQGVVSH